jgi:phospholipase/carboxylesterase
LYTGLRFPERLAGILAMSCYLPFPETLAAERSAANSDVPILLCHGLGDPVVPIAMGLEARDELKAHGYAPEWRDYPMQHAVCMEEIADVARWLQQRLTATVEN